MIAHTDHILVVNHDLPVGAAIVRRLIGLGHPRSHILTPSASELDGSDIASVRHYLQAKRLDQIYMWDPAFRHCGTTHANGRRAYSGLIEAALRAGVRSLIHVTTASGFSAEPAAHSEAPAGWVAETHIGSERSTGTRRDAVFLCTAMADAFTRGNELDYRCVLTCDPYGPGRTPTRACSQLHAGSTDRCIADMLNIFTAAKTSGASRVTVAIDLRSRFDLMFVDDVADAVVFLMELPRPQFRALLPFGSGHVYLGSGRPVAARDLVNAVATAAGFTGSVVIAPLTAAPDTWRPYSGDRDIVRMLGWKPLLPLQTGLELKAMALQISSMASREFQSV